MRRLEQSLPFNQTFKGAAVVEADAGQPRPQQRLGVGEPRTSAGLLLEEVVGQVNREPASFLPLENISSAG